MRIETPHLIFRITVTMSLLRNRSMLSSFLLCRSGRLAHEIDSWHETHSPERVSWSFPVSGVSGRLVRESASARGRFLSSNLRRLVDCMRGFR